MKLSIEEKVEERDGKGETQEKTKMDKRKKRQREKFFGKNERIN